MGRRGRQFNADILRGSVFTFRHLALVGLCKYPTDRCTEMHSSKPTNARDPQTIKPKTGNSTFEQDSEGLRWHRTAFASLRRASVAVLPATAAAAPPAHAPMALRRSTPCRPGRGGTGDPEPGRPFVTPRARPLGDTPACWLAGWTPPPRDGFHFGAGVKLVLVGCHISID